MDEDMDSAQIVFAQRLASGEPTIRARALKQLQNYIVKELKNNTFSEESLKKLCKGLHYTMWMQDKMLLQEELANNICNLINFFPSEDQVIEFVNALLLSLSKEWHSIDRWRMDKFLMFIRRLLYHIFARLCNKDWDGPLVQKYINYFCRSFISSEKSICESLKFHCASVYLDELDHAGGLDEENALKFLEPYVKLLQENISDSFFSSICTEIFDTILQDCSQQMSEECEDNEEVSAPGMKFNYGKLAELLFSCGSSTKVISRRRKRIYALSKRFDGASKKIDPYPPVEVPARKFKRRRRR